MLVLLGFGPVNCLDYIIILALEIYLLLGCGGEIINFLNSIGEVQDFNIIFEEILHEARYFHIRNVSPRNGVSPGGSLIWLGK